MVARGVCEFHVSDRERASAFAPRRRRSQLAAFAWSSLALFALSLAPKSACAEDLLLGAAVSLREPLSAIARDFEAQHAGARVHLSVGASSTLAAQAQAGAPIDVFVSADPRLVDRLERDGWSAARSDVARNSIVLVTAAGFALERMEDLLSPRMRRLALPAAAVPLGGYAREWLTARGLLERLGGRVIVTEHARATLAAVEAGHADAAIVYITDAQTGARAYDTLAIAASEQPDIRYTAALRAGSGALAREFFEALNGRAARERFTNAGFATP